MRREDQGDDDEGEERVGRAREGGEHERVVVREGERVCGRDDDEDVEERERVPREDHESARGKEERDRDRAETGGDVARARDAGEAAGERAARGLEEERDADGSARRVGEHDNAEVEGVDLGAQPR